MKLENTHMNQEIVDIEQEITDMKFEKAGWHKYVNMVFNVLLAVMMTFDSTLVFQVTLL